jgi:hypothetical protein
MSQSYGWLIGDEMARCPKCGRMSACGPEGFRILGKMRCIQMLLPVPTRLLMNNSLRLR